MLTQKGGADPPLDGSPTGGAFAQEPPTGGAFEEELAGALEEANLPTLLLVLAQLTGDERWTRDPYRPGRPRGPGDNDSGGFSSERQADIRDHAQRILTDWHRGRLIPAAAPTADRLAELLAISVAEALPDGYGSMIAEEMGLAGRGVTTADIRQMRNLEVLVVGAGVSGLLAAIELERAGVSFTVLEKDDAVGGTWYENTYPGAGVDTPTHLYSLSFAQRWHWERYFARRDQLHDYLEEVADTYDVRRRIRLGVEVLSADWDGAGQCWHVVARRADGDLVRMDPNVIITGVGYFNRPAYPSIPGLDSFSGPVMHTARWRREVDVEGLRIGVIGTGASAMQLVPSIAGVADRVIVFQRTPQWGLPHPNYLREVPAAVQWLMREVPHYQAWYRARLLWTFGDRLYAQVRRDADWPEPERSISAQNDRMREFLTDYIREQLGDRADELFDKCLPTYPPYGKRPLLDNGWFRTVARDDVELVTDAISEITPTGITTADGITHDVDVIVLSTGFEAQRMLAPMEITGRTGRTLRDVWGEDDPRAYLGISVPEFPNLFCLLGPNTFAGHGGSGILTIELQMRYVMEMLALMEREHVTSVECRQDVHDRYNDELAEALAETIWAHPGMGTYYRNRAGRIVVPMPWTNIDYWNRTRFPDLADYLLGRRHQRGPVPSAGRTP